MQPSKVLASSQWLRPLCVAFIALNLLAQDTPPRKEVAESAPGAADTSDSDARRAQAYKKLDALDLAIQSASRAGVNTTGLAAQSQELRRQLDGAVDDAETRDVTNRAASLMDKLTPRAKPRVKPAPAHVTPPPETEDTAPRVPEKQSSQSDTALILSGIALLLSIAAVAIAPVLCRMAIAKALKSAGLQ